VEDHHRIVAHFRAAVRSAADLTAKLTAKSRNTTRRSATDLAVAFEATIGFYERLVREQPAQWLLFDDVWPA
jgi:hypothetical protein